METKFGKILFAKRRRELIPIWMKPFIFLFLIFGILGIFGIGKNIMGLSSSSTIYGLESFTVFSLLGVFLKAIMFFKAITSFGLWMEKDWAVKFGIIDAVFGIIVCVIVMVVLPFVDVKDGINELNIRFEIFLLIPYLYQLLKVRKEWESLNESIETDSNIYESMQNKFNVEEKIIEVKEIEGENKMEVIINKEDPTRFMPK
jgi:hypothetical protein